MTVAIWQEPDGSLTVMPVERTRAEGLSPDATVIHTIEGADWTACMRQYHAFMGWEPYRPPEEPSDEHP